MPSSNLLIAGSAADIEDGGSDWNNISDVLTEQNAGHSIASKNGSTNILRLTNFPWPAIPQGQVLVGVEFHVRRWANSLGGADNSVSTNSAATPSGNLADPATIAATEETIIYGGPTDTLNVTDADLDSALGIDLKYDGISNGSLRVNIAWVKARLYWDDPPPATHDESLGFTATSSQSVQGGLGMLPGVAFPMLSLANSNGGHLLENMAAIAAAMGQHAQAGIGKDHHVSMTQAVASTIAPHLALMPHIPLSLALNGQEDAALSLAPHLSVSSASEISSGGTLSAQAAAVLGHLGDALAANDIDLAAHSLVAQQTGIAPTNLLLMQSAMAFGLQQAVRPLGVLEMPQAFMLSTGSDALASDTADYTELVIVHASMADDPEITVQMPLLADLATVQALGLIDQSDLAASAEFAGELASAVTTLMDRRAAARRRLQLPSGNRTVTLTKR